ncbi:MAG: shikimate dehydrogenase [Ignavibacteria bacterium]|nr:shikimate dehydrogenase [Ignavibacteria bacterium]
MIIVSVTGPSMKEALAQVAGSARYTDMFEFRLDMIERPNIAHLLSSTKKPTIATCRPDWEDGGFSGRERERIEMLEIASVFGAHYIDIELNANARIVHEFIRRQNVTKVIISRHLPYGKPLNVSKLYSKLHASGADIVKLAFLATDTSEIRHAFDFLALAKLHRRKAIAVAMGEYGEPSRVLYKKFGGWATYAASEDGKGAAQGQVCASQLKELYRANSHRNSTKVFGVIGNPLAQSKGIYIHNSLFARARKNSVYCRFAVANLRKFMKHIAPLLNGFSVTIPFKEKVLPYLDYVDSTTKAIGAVNTVIRRDGKLVGSNKDASAALDAVERAVNVRGRKMLVVGAGGTARAIAYEAKKRGAHVLITNRTQRKAKKLAKKFGLGHVKLADVGRSTFDILVNATSVGMVPRVDESPVPVEILDDKIVFDVVYDPPMTKLLRDAKSRGARIIQGTEMYLNQAAMQFETYSHTKPKIEVMRRILAHHMEGMSRKHQAPSF